MIENILVPEPALRYGLKQIKQNIWFKLYKRENILEKSAFEEIKVHTKILKEMKAQCPEIDINLAKCCLHANKKNNLTAHYNLILKNKELLGESLSEFSQLDLLDADANE